MTKYWLCQQPQKLMDQLMSCAQLEDAVEEQRQALANNIDVEELDIDNFKHQLKGLGLYVCSPGYVA